MLNILHIIYPQSGENIGGSDLYLLELSEMINAKTPNKSYIFYTRKGGLSHILEAKNTNVKSFFVDEKKNNFIKAAFSLHRIVEEFKIDIIHSHGYDANYLTALYKIFKSIFWRKSHKCFFVTTAHGWIYQPFPIFLKTLLDYGTFSFFDGVVIVNHQQKKIVKKLFLGKNTIVRHIPTAVTFRVEKGRKDDKRFENLRGIVFSFIGRLSKEKRIDLAIEVFKELLELIPESRCFIIGGGLEKEKVLNQLKSLDKRKKKRLVFKGYLPREKLQKILKEVNVLLISSDSEGCPRTALEAMNSRILVVSRDVGYMKKLIGRNKRGLILNSDRPHEIAFEIFNFLSNQRKKIPMILDTAKDYVSRYHSPEKFLKEYIRFYYKIYRKT